MSKEAEILKKLFHDNYMCQKSRKMGGGGSCISGVPVKKLFHDKHMCQKSRKIGGGGGGGHVSQMCQSYKK